MKRLTPWAAVAVAAILVSGCSAAQPHDAKTPTATVSTPSPSPTRAAGDLGDVVCFEQVTDTYGEYCHTTIAPDAAAMTLDESVIDLESLNFHGFSLDDVRAALPVALRDMTEDIMDPSSVDNSELPERESYMHDAVHSSPALRARALPLLKDFGDLWLNGISVSSILPEPGLRNGSARAAGGTTVEVTKISAGLDPDNKSNLIFMVKATAAYPLTDFQLVALYTQYDSSKRIDDLRPTDPQLFDGTNDSHALVVAETAVAFVHGDYEKVSAIGSGFNLTTERGTSYFANEVQTSKP